MICAEVDFVGEGEFGGGDAELVGLRGPLEDLVAARVFDFEGELAAGGGVVIGAVESEGAHVDGLAGLVNGLLGGEQDGKLVLKLNGLSGFAGADGGFDEVMELVVADKAGGKAELSFGGATTVEVSGEERPRGVVGDKQFDMH